MIVKNRWLIVSLSFLLIACGKKELIGSDHIIAQSRAVDAFNVIDIMGYYNVNITIGQPQAITLKVSDNLLPYIESTVKGKVLKIQTKKGYLLRPQGIPQLDLTVPEIHAIRLSGHNNVNVKSVNERHLDLDFAGSNQFEAQGEVKELQVTLAGFSVLQMPSLLTKKTQIISNGNSKIVINTKDSLDINISGNAIINYLGTPKIKQAINGSGAITKYSGEVLKGD